MQKSNVVLACAIACGAGSGIGATASAAAPNYADIQTVVVIFAENRSFDSLFGLYPGANGLSKATPAQYTQLDRNGTTLPYLPAVVGGLNSGVTAGAPLATSYPTQAQTGSYFQSNTINHPFALSALYNLVSTSPDPLTVTNRDLYHRFYENQMQANGGANNMFAAWADSGGLTMMYLPNQTPNHPLWKLAQQYTLADNFFQGAWGGSYLNHQFLICACAPIYPNDGATPTPNPKNPNAGGTSPAPSVITYNSNGIAQLTTSSTSPASALGGAPSFVSSTVLTPYLNGGTGYGGSQFFSVNTSFSAYPPSGTYVAATATTPGYVNMQSASTVPPQTQTTIGDLLDDAGVDWAYYSGGFCNALAAEAATANSQGATSTQVGTDTNCTGVTAVSYSNANPNFQYHHQPFNFYAHLDPNAAAPYGVAYRSDHLRDAGVASPTQISSGVVPNSQFLTDISTGNLPPVSFYKPNGPVNEHNGYSDITDGDKHIAAVVAALQGSPQWSNMLIVITYDEFGGIWDHVAPPKADAFGPGTRIPALIISPFAKKGFVDHTQYDTTSILRFIQNKWNLNNAAAPYNGGLPGISYRDSMLQANGYPAMGDLTNALSLP